MNFLISFLTGFFIVLLGKFFNAQPWAIFAVCFLAGAYIGYLQTRI